MENEALFRTIGNRDRLVDRVVDEIRRLMAEGHLSPGTRLPPERELAERIGVSRTVVREAVQTLIAKGLLESRQGVGTTVRQVTTDQIVEPLGWLMQAQGADLDDLHQVRSILEVEIAGLAAGHATDMEISELWRIVDEMAENQNDVEAFVASDAAFHQALAEITHNPLLAVLLDSIRELMQEVRRQVHRHPEVYATVVPDHRLIVEALAAQDPQAARTAMVQHLEHARTFQRAHIAAGGRM